MHPTTNKIKLEGILFSRIVFSKENMFVKRYTLFWQNLFFVWGANICVPEQKWRKENLSTLIFQLLAVLMAYSLLFLHTTCYSTQIYLPFHFKIQIIPTFTHLLLIKMRRLSRNASGVRSYRTLDRAVR